MGSRWSTSSWEEDDDGFPEGSMERRVEGWWWLSMDKVVRRSSPITPSRNSANSLFTSSSSSSASFLFALSNRRVSDAAAFDERIPQEALTGPFHKSNHQISNRSMENPNNPQIQPNPQIRPSRKEPFFFNYKNPRTNIHRSN
uniref:Uncharacterized protein n=1 Tax=Ananas comosus var. bracteatus TaxID=296719 RepID=A0A6V7NGD5_ANACO|nr:unnamed protein product [Ananas comosus var. bracteatus]